MQEESQSDHFQNPTEKINDFHPPVAKQSSSIQNLELWHQTMGHIGMKTLQLTQKFTMAFHLSHHQHRFSNAHFARKGRC